MAVSRENRCAGSGELSTEHVPVASRHGRVTCRHCGRVVCVVKLGRCGSILTAHSKHAKKSAVGGGP